MHIDVSEPGAFERLLTLRLDESELEPAKDKAARKLAGQLKIKGFRPGRAPRSVVERMVGEETLRSEAVDDALPELVGKALEERDLNPVTTPAVEDIRHRDDGGVEVDVRITLWPSVDAVPDYARTIEVDAPEIDEDELAAQIDRVRSQYAELEDVEREADEGDFVMVNLSASNADGVDIPEVSATDLLYEIGSMSYIPGLDPLLVGATVGAIKDGPAILPDGFGDRAGEEVTLKALVKGVKSRKLPDLTDEWVSDVSEFSTVDELRSRLSRSLLAMKVEATRGAYRDALLNELNDDLGLDIPEALIQAEMESSLHNLAHSLEQRGLDLGTYLSVTGQDQQAFAAELRDGAERSIQTRVLLEGVAAIEGLVVSEEEVRSGLCRHVPVLRTPRRRGSTSTRSVRSGSDTLR